MEALPRRRLRVSNLQRDPGAPSIQIIPTLEPKVLEIGRTLGYLEPQIWSPRVMVKCFGSRFRGAPEALYMPLPNLVPSGCLMALK